MVPERDCRFERKAGSIEPQTEWAYIRIKDQSTRSRLQLTVSDVSAPHPRLSQEQRRDAMGLTRPRLLRVWRMPYPRLRLPATLGWTWHASRLDQAGALTYRQPCVYQWRRVGLRLPRIFRQAALPCAHLARCSPTMARMGRDACRASARRPDIRTEVAHL